MKSVQSQKKLALQGEEQRNQNKSCVNASSVDGALKATGELVLVFRTMERDEYYGIKMFRKLEWRFMKPTKKSRRYFQH